MLYSGLRSEGLTLRIATIARYGRTTQVLIRPRCAGRSRSTGGGIPASLCWLPHCLQMLQSGAYPRGSGTTVALDLSRADGTASFENGNAPAV